MYFEVVKEKSAEYGIPSKEDCAQRLGGSKELDEKIVHDDILPSQARATHSRRQNIAFNEPGSLGQGTALLHSIYSTTQNHVSDMEKELASVKKSLSSFVAKSRAKESSINQIKNSIRKVER